MYSIKFIVCDILQLNRYSVVRIGRTDEMNVITDTQKRQKSQEIRSALVHILRDGRSRVFRRTKKLLSMLVRTSIEKHLVTRELFPARDDVGRTNSRAWPI